MNLVHFSAAPFALDTERTYVQSAKNFKPNGLWLSVEGNDDGWWRWCKGEDFNIAGLTYATPIALKEGANVLTIDSAGELDTFTLRYLIAPRYAGDCSIDWARVV